MIKIALFTLTLIISSISFGQSKKYKTTVIKTEIFCDHCIKCESCGQNIYNKLTENRGIKSIRIEDEINAISVKYNPKKINLDQIESAIAKAGYDANNTKANFESYQKLDNCCKKKSE